MGFCDHCSKMPQMSPSNHSGDVSAQNHDVDASISHWRNSRLGLDGPSFPSSHRGVEHSPASDPEPVPSINLSIPQPASISQHRSVTSPNEELLVASHRRGRKKAPDTIGKPRIGSPRPATQVEAPRLFHTPDKWDSGNTPGQSNISRNLSSSQSDQWSPSASLFPVSDTSLYKQQDVVSAQAEDVPLGGPSTQVDFTAALNWVTKSLRIRLGAAKIALTQWRRMARPVVVRIAFQRLLLQGRLAESQRNAAVAQQAHELDLQRVKRYYNDNFSELKLKLVAVVERQARVRSHLVKVAERAGLMRRKSYFLNRWVHFHRRHRTLRSTVTAMHKVFRRQRLRNAMTQWRTFTHDKLLAELAAVKFSRREAELELHFIRKQQESQINKIESRFAEVQQTLGRSNGEVITSRMNNGLLILANVVSIRETKQMARAMCRFRHNHLRSRLREAEKRVLNLLSKKRVGNSLVPALTPSPQVFGARSRELTPVGLVSSFRAESSSKGPDTPEYKTWWRQSSESPGGVKSSSHSTPV